MAGPPFPSRGPIVTSSGVEVATWHFGGDGPPLLLIHPTGFHGRVWAPLAPALTDRHSVWAVDLRGHGSSGKAPAGGYDHWDGFVDDVLAVVDVLGAPLAALGHSLGGAVALLAEQRRPGTFTALYCYEPVVFPPPGPGGSPSEVPLAALARKRRDTFPSRAAALENFTGKGPFARFDQQVVTAYVEGGFVDQADGTVTLACRRDDEASVYEGALRHRAFSDLGDVEVPVAVAGGGGYGSDIPGEVLDEITRRLARGTRQRFDDLGHFGPFEAPLVVGAAVARFLAEADPRVGPAVREDVAGGH